jgi:hypothetical protein
VHAYARIQQTIVIPDRLLIQLQPESFRQYQLTTLDQELSCVTGRPQALTQGLALSLMTGKDVGYLSEPEKPLSLDHCDAVVQIAKLYHTIA